MSGTFIAIIILTAIFGGYIIDYQKNKLKWQSRNAENNKDFDELKSELDRMRKRIENLEAIATDVSPDMNYSSQFSDDSIEIQNQKTVAKKAKNRGN